MSARPFATAGPEVTYGVSLRDPHAHLITVTVRIPQPDPAGQVLSLPAWIPGSYMIRDFARHVLALEAEADGVPVAVRKTDKSSWRVAPVAAELLVRATVYANDGSVRGAQLDARGGFFNGCCLFPRVHGMDAGRCIVNIDPGEHPQTRSWRVATSLRRLTGAAADFGAFEAQGYDELIDHPVLLGDLTIAEFTAAGVPHALVLAGRHEADTARMTEDLRRLCEWQIRFFGTPAPMERYFFLVRLTGEGFGGLEHRASAALVCHRNNLARRGDAETPAGYRDFLGLASHEYFHLWNVKRILPAEFSPYRLDQETCTRQLWIFEGLTAYYEDIALLRAGLVTPAQFLELLGRTLTSVYRAGGRRRQTLEEASFDAWIKFYRPDENAPNALVSYYGKGAMVALALDLEIRLRSQGRMSLDTVMGVLWKSHGEAHGAGSGRPLAEGAFEELVHEVTGLDLGEFFEQALRGTVDPPVGVLLAQFGVRLNLRAAESTGDRGGTAGQREHRPRPWLGIRSRVVQGRVRVASVLDGGPAQAAGMSADDELLAIGGLRVDADGFDTLLDRCDTTAELPVHVFRRDELLEFTVRLALPPRDTCYLTPDTGAAPEAAKRREAWLAGADAKIRS